MYPIDTQDGFFHDGDGISELGTVLPASWLNQVQAELIAILTAAGIKPEKANQSQVTAAIKKLIAANVPASATDKVAGITRIIDSLDSDDALAALSARQGKALFDCKLDKDGVAKTALYAELIAARKIGGVTFNAKSDIDLPGVNIAGNQDTTGNADSATRLKTARLINGVPFDGSKDINTTPSGAIMYFSQSMAPTGWLKANGAALSRTTYSNLFAAIGTMYGSGDGNTTFNLPDLRAEFIRSWDDGRNVDGGRKFGSWQDSQNLSHMHNGRTWESGVHNHTGWTHNNGDHNHGVPISTNGAGSNFESNGGNIERWGSTNNSGIHSHYFVTDVNGNHTHDFATDVSGGNEARPRNIALLACIKI